MSKVISYKLYVLSFPEKVDELIWLSQILSIKNYELSIEKVIKSFSPCKKMRNDKRKVSRKWKLSGFLFGVISARRRG